VGASNCNATAYGLLDNYDTTSHPCLAKSFTYPLLIMSAVTLLIGVARIIQESI
jgi:hypothetical protein